ncbi:PREDICTED: uncharacterized protein K02A2.6-like [Wasmannia auropunctata]|uniref:uncharacterized protein K02A2.6-like n=1 Tax=Wasmannia auropunctata TaxID=64793 RepID=UPI0005EF970B|nr:PREDICTED: uncharacterized protein K02A2.6-like [Wasmannia auropunctata]
MEIDTGTYVTIMSEETKKRYFPSIQIETLNTPLKAYGKVPLEHVGITTGLEVQLGRRKATLKMIIMKGSGPTLIGRQWLQALALWPLPLNELVSDTLSCHKIDLSNVIKEFPSKFPKLFGPGTGLYNKGVLKLVLRENSQPKAFKARHLPFALTKKVENEINRLEALGHLKKVDVSDWATPIVPVIKSNGTVRICGNFKLTVNPCLVMDRHPLPLIDEIFLALQNGEKFSQIDLQHAYMQIPVDEKSQDYLTIITHKGLYKYTKMTEGIASGPGDFQRKIEQCLAGIEGVIPYLDNIFCTGSNDKKHWQALNTVFTRLEEAGFKININKCDFFKDRLDVLGFVIDKNGLHKAETKVKAMIHAPTPKNKKQLDSFLGLITYYARFLPDRAERLKPLYECAKQGEFKWSKECASAFEWVKTELASPRVLAHFDPEEELVLACDASAYGIAAILSHRYKDKTERPIAFASKVIPESELNRAIIDKEASAIVFGFKKFYNYIFGKQIILRTDHKPLTHIFGPKQEIPLTVASRLQRWAYFLSRFSYTIEYIKSGKNSNCDALSRLPIDDATPIFNKEFTAINYIEESEILNAGEIARESKSDKTLSRVIRYVRNGWPKADELSGEERNLYAKREELSVDKGCVLWGYRVVVPEKFRGSVLRELHASHFGIVKIKMIARSYVWWPNIDSEIENMVAACTVCVRERKTPASVPLTPWPYPDRFWSRIHADFLGPFHGHMFMVIVDAYSKWPEIIDMHRCTQAPKTIEEFKKILGRHGLPRHLVTDNGTQYTSNEFRDFVNRNGIKHSFTAPYHPATNGAAENFVETFKDKVDKIVKSGKPLDYAVNLFLFDYRTSEHCTTGRTPAYMVYKRELRTRFDLLKPDVNSDVSDKQLAQVIAKNGSRSVELQIGETVMVNDYSTRNDKRIEGKIVQKLSPVTYRVEISPGKVWKRHVDQIIKYPKANVKTASTIGATEKKLPDILRRSERLKK